MYYHAIIEVNEKDKKGNYLRVYERDVTDLDEIINLIVKPYKEKKSLYVNGRYIDAANVRLLKIKSSNRASSQLRDIAQSNVRPGVFFVYNEIGIIEGEKYVADITKDVLKSIGNILDEQSSQSSLEVVKNASSSMTNDRIFIVHGRDDKVKIEVARFIEKLGFNPIILHEQASSGKTIIEKIEANTNVGFAIVLYTACDIGGIFGDSNQKPRARQNVVFEHGYLIGRLGRDKVCALVKSGVETPNDISGVVYVTLDDHGAWHVHVAKELRQAGFAVDMNKIL